MDAKKSIIILLSTIFLLFTIETISYFLMRSAETKFSTLSTVLLSS